MEHEDCRIHVRQNYTVGKPDGVLQGVDKCEELTLLNSCLHVDVAYLL